MAKKFNRIIIGEKTIDFEYDCPDCPEKKRKTTAVKPDNQTNDEIKKMLKKKFPESNVD